MAIIKCPECSAEISDKAYKCPKCGMPMTPIEENSELQNMQPINYNSNNVDVGTVTSPAFVAKNKRNLAILYVVMGIVTVCVILVVVISNGGSGSSKNSLVGKWVMENNAILTFQSNGTAQVQNEFGTTTFEWSINGNTMTWYMNGNSNGFSYNWYISGNCLYIDDEYYATKK